jgi:16S rRNA processing protein RimM
VSETVEVVVGVIGRAHGVRGDVAVVPRTDEPERRFAEGATLRAEDSARVFTVADARDHSGRLLVRFAEITDRNEAEAARGIRLVVDVPIDERPEEDEEFYDRQLVGLAAVAPDGTPIGPVTAVLHPPGQDLLEIETADGVRLVPFVTALVPDVDLAAGTVTITAVAGLLEDEPDEETAAGEGSEGDTA